MTEPSGPDVARARLRELVATYGRAVLDDPRRCEALLRDLCGDRRREVNLLVSALRERVPMDLLNASAGVPRGFLITQLAQRLHDNLGIADAFARWAVESWALALGLVAEADLLPPPPPAAPTVSAPSLPSRSAAEYIIDPSGRGDYRTLGEALRRVAANARLLVQPGVYRESLFLDKPVEIQGQGPLDKVVISADDAACIVAMASATLRGLTLTRWGTKTKGAALDVTRGSLTLDGCAVSATARACIAVGGRGASLTARRCQVHDGANTGLLFYDEATGVLEDCDIVRQGMNGVQITQGANPTLTGCQVRQGREIGVWVDDAGRGTLDGCSIVGNLFQGVLIGKAGAPTIRRCTIRGNSVGVWVAQGAAGLVEQCEIIGNRERSWYAEPGHHVVRRGNREY